MTFAERYAAGTNTAFIQRVTVAALLVASEVAIEPDNTANHAVRVRLAAAVTNGASRYGGIFAQVIAANDVGTTATDDAIKAAVADDWDTVAGQV